MIVTITNPTNGLNELCLLEFQGEIVGKEMGGSLGSIIKLKGDIAELEIGAYMLDGQVSTLKNPYLVIEKVENSVTTTGSFDMIGIVKKKILFKSRPKPKAFSAKPADIEN